MAKGKGNKMLDIPGARAARREELVRDIALLAEGDALVIRSGKPSGFIAGADIEEFLNIKSGEEALAMVKRGWDRFNKLEALPFPTVALIDGFQTALYAQAGILVLAAVVGVLISSFAREWGHFEALPGQTELSFGGLVAIRHA